MHRTSRAHRGRLAEAQAAASTRWLQGRRAVRRLHHRCADQLRPALTKVTAWLIVATGVLGALAALAAAAGSHALETVAATAEPRAPALTEDRTVVEPAAAPAPEPTVIPAPVLDPGVPPPAAPSKGGIPAGKGMWIWQPDAVEAGDVNTMVARANAAGLTHLYVRTGSSWQGFHGAAFLDAVLPAAHAAGLRVYGWDFPTFADINADVQRALTAITYTTPAGHRIDGFVPDIETPSEGTYLSPENVAAYGGALRAGAGPNYPLIACVPAPTAVIQSFFPYAEATAAYDAIAPMVYWFNREPDADVANAMAVLAPYGKPVIPIGQSFDAAAIGGRPGPTPDEIVRFLATAEGSGATAVSFWSWQHTSDEIWATLAAAPQFAMPLAGPVVNLSPGQIRTVQALLAGLGYPSPITGAWDATTATALMAFQRDIGLAPTGAFDPVTRSLLAGPLVPPLG